jgi:hypothetical protein
MTWTFQDTKIDWKMHLYLSPTLAKQHKKITVIDRKILSPAPS